MRGVDLVFNVTNPKLDDNPPHPSPLPPWKTWNVGKSIAGERGQSQDISSLLSDSVTDNTFTGMKPAAIVFCRPLTEQISTQSVNAKLRRFAQPGPAP